MTKWFLHRTSRVPLASAKGSDQCVGNISMKELYEIAKAKQNDPQYVGVPLRAICLAVLGTASSMGIRVTRERLTQFAKRDDIPVWDLERLRKDERARKKAERRRE